MKLTKEIIKLGNSAGVILPKKWCGGKAVVELIKKPLNIKQDVLEILDKYLDSVLGIYLVGSYARKEEDENSDIDVLVVTLDVNERLVRGKYDILLMSMDEVEKAMKIVVPLVPMIAEAVPIMNKYFLEQMKKNKFEKKHLKWHISTTKSSMKINKLSISISKEANENISDNVGYSLVLRLRELYIINSLIKNEKATKKEFVALIKSITGSVEMYESYLRIKNGKHSRKIIAVDKAEKIYCYILDKIKDQEKWTKTN